MRDRAVLAVLGLTALAGCASPSDHPTSYARPTDGLYGLGISNPDPGPVVARLVKEVDPRYALLDPTLIAQWAGQTCADLTGGRAPEEVTRLAAARFSTDTTAGRITVTPDSGGAVVATVAPSCWPPTR